MVYDNPIRRWMLPGEIEFYKWGIGLEACHLLFPCMTINILGTGEVGANGWMLGTTIKSQLLWYAIVI